MELDPRLEALLRTLQIEEGGHAALALRARRIHERKLAREMTELVDGERSGRIEQAIPALVGASLPVVPYIPAGAMLARERAKLVARDGDPMHVAVVADGLAHVHGVGQTLAQLRERGLRGHEIDLIGTDANVDRRLPAVTEVELPHYPGLRLGVPSLSAVAEALTERHYDLVHVCAPGPAGIAAALMARVMALPLLGSYHTELQAYVRTRTGDPTLEATVGAIVAKFYASCAVVLSPSKSADASLERLGIPTERLFRWQRGVDTTRFNPSRRGTTRLPGRFNILYVGRMSREKGVDLLAEAYLDLEARQRDRRLHLVLAGRGPEEELLRKRLGAEATFLGWLDGRRAGQYLRQRRPVRVPEHDRYVRTGHSRGPGERPTGARGAGGWPDRADRGWANGLPRLTPPGRAGDSDQRHRLPKGPPSAADPWCAACGP